MSKISGPVRSNVIMPGKPIEEYLDIKDPALKAKYNGMNKIPLQLFYDAYFEGKIEVKGASARVSRAKGVRELTILPRGPVHSGDLLDVLEYRHDWAVFHMSWNLLKYVFTVLVPDVIRHDVNQDEEQVRDHYDRGDDFCKRSSDASLYSILTSSSYQTSGEPYFASQLGARARTLPAPC